MLKNIAPYIISIFIISALFLPSCEPIEADVAAYVQIDSVNVTTDISTQGTSNHKITDIWFNLDGSRVGTFEIPTKFPVIAEGKRPVSISAGIIKSGIHDFREVYPFFKIIRDTFDFVGAEAIPYYPTFEYKEETKFWIEDFEDPGLKLHTNDSINRLKQIIDPNNQNNHLGHVYLPDTVDAFLVYTKINIKLSTTPIYLEIEYKSDEAFSVGILTEQINGSYEDIRPFSIIKASPEWNKLYLNLAEQFNINPGAISYDIYLFFATDQGGKANVYLDNLKIVSF